METVDAIMVGLGLFKQNSEEQFRKVIQALPLGVHLYSLNSEGQLIFSGYNEAADRILQVTHKPLVGKVIDEAFPSLVNTEIPKRYKQIAKEGGRWHTDQIEYEDQQIKGAYEVDIFQYAPGGLVVMFQDITEIKKALAQLKLLGELIDISPVSIAIHDFDGKFYYVNRKMVEYHGYSKEDLLQKKVKEIDHPESAKLYKSRIETLKREGETSFEVRHRKKDGTDISLLVYAKLAQWENIPVVLSAALDISELKQSEQKRLHIERQLLHAQKLESLGVLAGGIAHDFNNLLMAILGNLDLVMIGLSSSSPVRRNIEAAINAATRATDLTRQMLAYSGKGKFLLQKIDLSKLVEENIFILKAALAKNVTLEVNLNNQLDFIIADVGQIQQIVMNLITNASEAIGEKQGTVRVTTSQQEYDQLALIDSIIEEKPQPGKFVTLEITDTGCGMDLKTKQRLFEPFFTTKFAGRGLGLSAVLGIVRSHRGAIFVDSVVGQGTKIRVLLPVANPRSEVEIESVKIGRSEELSQSRFSGTALIVDDEEYVRDLCGEMVKYYGFNVIYAADGEEAVNVFRVHQDKIAIVILDLTMPRMDGIATLENLIKIRPDVKVILSSGYNEQMAIQRLTERGVAGFIQKPYTMQALENELQRVFSVDN